MTDYDPETLFGEQAQDVCFDVAVQIAKEIQDGGLVPVRTGKLRDSYDARRTDTGAEVTSSAYYWKYVEFGHRIVAWGYDTGRYQPAQPHVRPAIEIIRTRNGK